MSHAIRLVLLLLACLAAAANTNNCPYSQDNTLASKAEGSCPLGVSSESGAEKSKCPFDATKDSKGCPFGFNKHFVDGSNCPYGYKKSALKPGCPAGFKNTPQTAGKGCPMNFKKQSVAGTRCPYGYKIDSFANDGKCPAGFQKSSATGTRCPIGLKKVLVDGSKCPYGYTKSFNINGGCPHGFKKTGSGSKCPLGLEKNANTKCPYGYTSKAAAHDGKCPFNFKLAKEAGGCPYGFQKNYVPGSKCPYGYTRESVVEGKCPQGFVQTPGSKATCPYGFQKIKKAGSKCPLGYTKESVSKGCPHGFSKSKSACPLGYNKKEDDQHSYPIGPKDREAIKNIWNVAKKNGNIAPKAFLQYFKLKPEKQKLFPAFADVDLADLPTNAHFLNQAYTCVSSLNPYIGSLGKSVKKCSYLNGDKFTYLHPQDLKDFSQILFSVMAQELGSAFPADLFKNHLNSCISAFTFKKSANRN